MFATLSAVEIPSFLLLISCLVAVAARKFRLPYTVGLVISGGLLGASQLVSGVPLSKDLIFSVFLPPLIFEASLAISWRKLKRELLLVSILALFGVMVTSVVVAYAMTSLVGWPLSSALLFGALISATDPVAVIATFKQIKTSERLKLLVEAESLLNDGVAALAFTTLLAFALGKPVAPGAMAFDLIKEIAGGVAVGGVVARFTLWFGRHTNDYLIDLSLTATAAYGSFILAQYAGCSGVLSTLACGMILANGDHEWSLKTHSERLLGFWEFIAFVVNSFIFLLIGVDIHGQLGAMALGHFAVLVAIPATLAGRAISIYLVGLGFLPTKARLKPSHQHVLVWSGLRGAMALALALGLPDEIPNRSEIVAVCFGVVAFSVIVQGITTPGLLQRLKLSGSEP